MAARGAYAKGIAKREEILTAALDVIARHGYSATSLKEIADAVDLSQAGVLHYFGSKDELFVEVLRRRDAKDRRTATGDVDLPDSPATTDLEATGLDLSAFARVIRHNTEVPGLVALYARLAAEATDPAHPAHAYFVERRREFISQVTGFVAALQEAGRLREDADPGQVATMLHALADGLQTHWLMDPEVDMAGLVEAFIDLLGARPAGTPGRHGS